MIISESQKDHSDHGPDNGLVVGKLAAGYPVQEGVVVLRRGCRSLNKKNGNGDREEGMHLRGISENIDKNL